ncbi:hypothetical protein [Pseudarthrobacter sp. IC2-21]|uniref:O-antigen ligase family protein n=1 Tax=Pseudarthrobacter sp. IC2-21 TaxID=3092262 RepID=UPI002A6AB0FC|nr:hypothetical protein [Pseudarthrobacter sp. IC2-21]
MSGTGLARGRGRLLTNQSGLAALFFAIFAIFVIGLVVSFDNILAKGVVMATFVGVLLAIVLGLRKVSFVLAFGAFFFAPMIGVRVAEAVTVGDAFLVAAVAVALLSARESKPLPRTGKNVALVGGFMVAGGTVATLTISQDATTSVAQMGQYAIAIVLSLGLVRLLKPSKGTVVGLGIAFGLGATVSCVVALMDKVNPRPAGLALHSNHLAISAALAVGIWLAIMLATKSKLLSLLALVGIVVCVWGTVIGGSRAGVVALVTVFMLTILGIGASKLTAFLALACGGVGYAIQAGFIDISGQNNAIGRLLGGGSAEQADMGRSVKYEGVWDRINLSPFLGTGFADARDGHSLYLQMWDSAGVMGILAAAVLIMTALFGYLAARRRNNRVSLVLWSGYLGYLAAAILSNQMWDRYLWLGRVSQIG